MAQDYTAWKAVQYRGDRNDLAELYDSYKVESYIRMWEEKHKRSEDSIRRRLTKDSVLLTRTLSPRVYGIVEHIKRTLEVDIDFDIFCIASNNINAYADIDTNSNGEFPFIVITSKALEELNNEEITFIIGHELGHILFRHNRVLHLKERTEKEDSDKETVLPYLGEHVFLNWRKKSEVSADRIGYLCAGSFTPCARALIKTGVGLSEKNLNLDIQLLLEQIEKIRDKPEILDTDFRTHPLLPIRLKSLELFDELRQQNEYCSEEYTVMEDRIDDIFAWLERFPRKETDRAVMHILAASGMRMLRTHEQMQNPQIEELYLIMHRYFLNDPERVLLMDDARLEEKAQQGYAVLRKQPEDKYTTFIISRLADVALARGRIREEEAEVIADTAGQLGESRETALSILISAASTVGFKTDVKLNKIVDSIRTSFYTEQVDLMEAVLQEK